MELGKGGLAYHNSNGGLCITTCTELGHHPACQDAPEIVLAAFKAARELQAWWRALRSSGDAYRQLEELTQQQQQWAIQQACLQPCMINMSSFFITGSQ